MGERGGEEERSDIISVLGVFALTTNEVDGGELSRANARQRGKLRLPEIRKDARALPLKRFAVIITEQNPSTCAGSIDVYSSFNPQNEIKCKEKKNR